MPAKKKTSTPGEKKAACKCSPDVAQIRQTAYTIWEAKGCPENSDVENWLEAESRLNV